MLLCTCKLNFAYYKSSLEKISEAEFDAYNLVCKEDTTSPDKSNLHSYCGAEGIRTPDLRLAKAALSQLSYSPLAKSIIP